MTIKITKPGTLPETRVFGANCRHCGCEFTFNPPDAKYETDQRDGDFYRIPCPTCGQDCFNHYPSKQTP